MLNFTIMVMLWLIYQLAGLFKDGLMEILIHKAVELTGSIIPGGFYIICNDAAKFNATFGLNCDLDIGTGGFADSNGDDNMALLLDGVVVDMFGIPVKMGAEQLMNLKMVELKGQ